MSCYVYLIQSKINNSYYVGISENPERRLVEHNSGKLKITSKKKPYTLVYMKKYEDYNSARKHEIWLKKKNRVYKDRLACPAPNGRDELAPPKMGGVK